MTQPGDPENGGRSDVPPEPGDALLARVKATARRITDRVNQALTSDTKPAAALSDGTLSDARPLPPDDPARPGKGS